jgi:membrane-bound lytic murein transglycosylase A
VQLPVQSQFLVGYDCANGRSYTAIGRVLLKSGALTPGHSSMQDIRAWLNQHPEKIPEVLNQNPSYVFFRILENKEALGSQQAPLTPERSLAVDRKYIPLGVPVWLDIASDAFRHLMVAQDVGGAIKGIIRGDVYWGGGEKAEFIAGHMKSQGSYAILLPRA